MNISVYHILYSIHTDSTHSSRNRVVSRARRALQHARPGARCPSARRVTVSVTDTVSRRLCVSHDSQQFGPPARTARQYVASAPCTLARALQQSRQRASALARGSGVTRVPTPPRPVYTDDGTTRRRAAGGLAALTALAHATRCHTKSMRRHWRPTSSTVRSEIMHIHAAVPHRPTASRSLTDRGAAHRAEPLLLALAHGDGHHTRNKGEDHLRAHIDDILV